MDLHPFIRDVHDFPKPGIVFKDITPLLESPEAFAHAVDTIAARCADIPFDKILGIESRGFIFGAALAYKMRKGLVLVRKPGKLPAGVFTQSYDLEYGQDSLEVHQDAVRPGERVLVLDDLLATGGTLEATVKMVEQMKAEVAAVVTVIELTFLDGRKRLGGADFYTLLQY